MAAPVCFFTLWAARHSSRTLSNRADAFIMFKILGAISLLILLLAASAWWLFTIPFSQTTLRKLRPGMSQTQVYAILGPANQTNQLGSVETWWLYSHRPSVAYLCVVFDSAGRYKEHVID